MQKKMEKGNNFRIFCSKTAFENRKIIIETISNNYVLEKTRQRKVMQEEPFPYLLPMYTGLSAKY